MIKAKKINAILLLFIMILLSASCNIISNVIDAFDRKDRAKLAQDIVDCFNNEDVEGLKNMFCTYSNDRHDLDDEITTAFEFLNGSIIDFTLNRSSESSSVDAGRESYLQYSYLIEDITVDLNSDYTYLIAYIYRERCDDYKETEGITYMKVFRMPIDDNRKRDDYVAIGEGKVPRIASNNRLSE